LNQFDILRAVLLQHSSHGAKCRPVYSTMLGDARLFSRFCKCAWWSMIRDVIPVTVILLTIKVAYYM